MHWSIKHLILYSQLFFLINALQLFPKCKNSVTTASGSVAPKGPYYPGQLIFEDHFNTFNLDVWKHEISLGGGGNWEFQFYNNNRSNSYVENGILHIKPTLLADIFGEDFLSSGQMNLVICTNNAFNGCDRTGSATNYLNPIVSARLELSQSFSFKFGTVEIRAKLPTGDWLSAAMWFNSKNQPYGVFPASGLFAIESRGNLNLTQGGENIGAERINYGIGYGPYFRAFVGEEFHTNSVGYGWTSEFHKYQMEWTPENIVFKIDDVITQRVDVGDGFWERGGFGTKFPNIDNPWKSGSPMAPFDQEFFLLMNLYVGGVRLFPDDAVNSPKAKPWKNSSPTATRDFWKDKNNWLPTWNLKGSDDCHLQVDYVKIWAI